MICKFNFIFTIILIIYCLILPGCRTEYVANESDLSEQGWDLYLDGKYLESSEWFQYSVDINPSLDVYNGLGWSHGKLSNMDISINSFLGYETLSASPNDQSIKRDIWAGLCFAYSANGEDSKAIDYGDSLFSSEWYDWTFLYESELDSLDVLITVAMSAFSIGDFGMSLNRVNYIMDKKGLNTSESFNPDVSTTQGRLTLISKIEELQSILSPQ